MMKCLKDGETKLGDYLNGMSEADYMESVKLISRLWSAVYDLLLYCKGESTKELSAIEQELDALEYECRRFACKEV